ncbi:MAG: pseudouridine synthase [Oscillospiraceae bacterium]
MESALRENAFTPALCNRIDRNTGGIVIAAKNAETLRILNEKIHARELEKRYLCITSTGRSTRRRRDSPPTCPRTRKRTRSWSSPPRGSGRQDRS